MSALSDALARIRHFLSSSTAQPDVDLHQAARVYAEAWGETARRLERIRALADEGLAWEAVQLAEAYPPMLEQCPLLLFDRHAEWIQQAELNDMPVPTVGLSMAMFQQVNDAYLASEQLAPAMRDLHRAVLSRAGLPQRIRALRALRKANPEQPVWDRDLRALEELRQQHLKHVLDAAMADKDIGSLCWIQRQLHADTWAAPPDPALVRRADKARDAVAATTARNRYREVAEAVEKAFTVRDTAALTEEAGRWRALPSLLGEPPDDAAGRVAPALTWLDAEIARREADAHFARDIRQLELMLAEDTPVDLMEKTVRDIDASGRLLPEELSIAVAKRRMTHDLERRRQTTRRTVFIAGGVILLLALGAAGWWQYSEHVARVKAQADDERRIADEQAAREEERREIVFAEQVNRVRATFDRDVRVDHDAALLQLSQNVKSVRDREALNALRQHIDDAKRADRDVRTGVWNKRLERWGQTVDGMNARLKEGEAAPIPEDARAAWRLALEEIETEHRAPTDRDGLSAIDVAAFETLRSRARLADNQLAGRDRASGWNERIARWNATVDGLEKKLKEAPGSARLDTWQTEWKRLSDEVEAIAADSDKQTPDNRPPAAFRLLLDRIRTVGRDITGAKEKLAAAHRATAAKERLDRWQLAVDVMGARVGTDGRGEVSTEQRKAWLAVRTEMKAERAARDAGGEASTLDAKAFDALWARAGAVDERLADFDRVARWSAFVEEVEQALRKRQEGDLLDEFHAEWQTAFVGIEAMAKVRGEKGGGNEAGANAAAPTPFDTLLARARKVDRSFERARDVVGALERSLTQAVRSYDAGQWREALTTFQRQHPDRAAAWGLSAPKNEAMDGWRGAANVSGGIKANVRNILNALVDHAPNRAKAPYTWKGVLFPDAKGGWRVVPPWPSSSQKPAILVGEYRAAELTPAKLKDFPGDFFVGQPVILTKPSQTR